MSKFRDIEFDKYNPKVYKKDCRSWFTTKSNVPKKYKIPDKYKRCSTCGANVIFPCVLCHPEEYA